MINKEEQTIRNPSRIHWLLNSLKSQRQLIVLTLDKTDFADRSLIVEVCPEQSFFSLDVSVDPTIHNKLVNGHPFSFDTSLNGVNVRADSLKASGTLVDENGMLYNIPFPSELFYKQRRDSFRAPLRGSFDINVPVEIRGTETDNPLTLTNCNLSDISADGCKLSIPEDDAKYITDITHPVTLQLEIPNSGETLALSAIPRHNRHLKSSSLCLIGFELIDTPPHSQDVLSRFVTSLQLLARQRSVVDD